MLRTSEEESSYIIEDVFDVRMDVFAHKENTLNYAFSNKMGRAIPEIKKEGG